MSRFIRKHKLLLYGVVAGTSAIGLVVSSSTDGVGAAQLSTDRWFRSDQTSSEESGYKSRFSSANNINKVIGPVLASWTNDFEPSTKWDYNWDRRDPKFLANPKLKKIADESKCSGDKNDYENDVKKNTATATRHLFFIRHGQYETEAADDKDRILTKLGREQATLTGQRLKELDLPYTHVVNSTMSRAIETADLICEEIEIPNPRLSCDLLREGAPYPPEPPIGHWKPNVYQFFEDGSRIEAAFRKHVHRASPNQTEDSYEVIVCHANVIRYIVCRALQLPPEAWLRMSLKHASITRLTVRPSGRVSIQSLGDSGHMPPELLSIV